MGRIQFANGAPAGPPHLGSDELHIDRETGALHFLGPDDAPKVGGLPALDAVPSTYCGDVIRVGADLWQWKLRLPNAVRASFEDIETITLAGHSNAAMNTTYTLAGVSGGYVLYVSADEEYQLSLGPDEAFLDDEGNPPAEDEYESWTHDGESAFLAGTAGGQNDGATVSSWTKKSGCWAEQLSAYACSVWRRNLYRVGWKTNGATRECLTSAISEEVDVILVSDALPGGVNYVAPRFDVKDERIIQNGDFRVNVYQQQALKNNDLVGVKRHIGFYETAGEVGSRIQVYLQTDEADAITRYTFVEIWVRNLYTYDELN